MDALRDWMESDLDVIIVGTWMLCGNGWSLIWTLSWLAHGCSVRGKLKKHCVPRGFRHVKYEELREMPRIPSFFAVHEAVFAPANAMMVGIIRNPPR